MNTINDRHEIIVNNQNPYLGLESFREEHKEYFHGRSEDVQKLFRQVENHTVTILFGSSGLGKTSLLEAGLFPKLRENFYLPIYIRLRFNDSENTPIKQAKIQISDKISEIDKDAISISGLSLWEYLHRVEILNGLIIPVIVFDQFEEIFTVGKKNLSQITEFINELVDLVENQIPLSVQEKYENSEISFSFNKQNYRIVISLREDYLPKLEQWNDFMPSIKLSRFPVLAMGREQAFEAISKPGKHIIDEDITNQILDLIILATDLDTNVVNQDYEYEPFLLSLICYKINKVRLDKKQDKINEAVIQDINIKDIITKHYIENTNDQERYIIEEHLLTLDGYRNFQVLDDIYQYRITPDQIEALINSRIIRKSTIKNTVYIELIHDVLVSTIRESRDKRKEKERREREKRILEQQKKKIRKTVLIIGCVIVFALPMIWISLKNRQAKIVKAQTIAMYSQFYRAPLQTYDPTLSLRLAEAAYDIESKNILIQNKLIDAYLSGTFYDIEINHNKKKILSTEISWDKKFLFVKYADETAILHNLENNKPQFDFGISISHANFSKNGNHIVTVSPDNVIRIWDMNGNIVSRLADSIPGIKTGKTSPINTVEFSADGNYVLLGRYHSIIPLWNWQEENTVHFLEHEGHTVFFTCFTNDGSRIITSTMDGVLTAWDTNGSKLATVDSPNGFIKKIEFSDSGNYFITINDLGIAHLWNFSDGQFDNLKQINNEGDNFESAKFTPDSKAVILISEINKNEMKLYTIENIEKSKLENIENSNDEIKSIELKDVNTEDTLYVDKNSEFLEGPYPPSAIPDSSKKNIDIGSNISKAGSILKTPIPKIIFQGHTGSINSIEFSGDGLNVITSSDDKTVRIWDLKGIQKIVLLGHREAVIGAHFLNNDSIVLTTSFDNTSREWQLERFTSLNPEEIKTKATKSVSRTNELNRDKVSMGLFYDTKNDTVYLLNHTDTTHVLAGHKFVTNVFISQNEEYLVTSSTWTNTSMLWNNNGDSLERIDHAGKILKTVDISEIGKSMLLLFEGNKFEIHYTKKNKTKSFHMEGMNIEDTWFSQNDYIFIKCSDRKVIEVPINASIIKEQMKKSLIWKMDKSTMAMHGLD